MSAKQDQDDLIDALFAMSQTSGKRPSIQEAGMKHFPDWDRDRLFDAAQALETAGAILNPAGPMLHVDLSSTARKEAAARAAPRQAPSSSSTTYNIGSVHNSPFQHVEAGGHGTQNTSYSANDLGAIIELYRQHVDELGLDSAARRRADAQVATIEAQLIDEPDPGIVKAAGKSLKTIVEGAIGGALGNAVANPGVWTPLLAMFG